MSPLRILLGCMCVVAVIATSIEDPETLQSSLSPSSVPAAEAPLTPQAVITPASSSAAERANGYQQPFIDTTAHAIIPSGAQTVTVQKTLKGVQLEPGRVAPLVVYPRYLTKQAESDGCPCSGQNSRILNIMTFNILRDLDDCPFPKPHCINALAEKILAYQVDVAGFQEVTRWLRSGWTILEQVVEILNKTRPFEYTAIPFTTIITRLPVLYVDKWFKAGGSGAILELAPGVNMAFYTAHVVAYPYGPYELRDHAHKGVKAVKTIYKMTQKLQLRDTKKVLNRIRRLHRNSDVQEALSNQLGGASSIRKDNYAIVVTGDFNIPSHLDHTIAVSKSNFYNQARGFKALPFPWPVSMYFDYWKYRDAYREFYPDPIAKPGFTWTSMPDKKEVYDRIDYIFLRDHSHKYGASKKHIQMQVVEAKRVEPVVVTPDGRAGYFSDHRGVFSRVQFTWPEGRGGDDGSSERVLRSAKTQQKAAAAQLRRVKAAVASASQAAPAAQESTASAPKMRASMTAAASAVASTASSAEAEIDEIA